MFIPQDFPDSYVKLAVRLKVQSFGSMLQEHNGFKVSLKLC